MLQVIFPWCGLSYDDPYDFCIKNQFFLGIKSTLSVCSLIRFFCNEQFLLSLLNEKHFIMCFRELII